MPSIGAPEIVIILVLALLVFGPKRLPEMGRSLGRAVREFRKATDTARKEFGVDEIEREMKGVKQTIADVKGDLKVDLGPGTPDGQGAPGATPASGAAGTADGASVAAETGAAGATSAATAAVAASAAAADPAPRTADGDEVLVGEVVDSDLADAQGGA